MLKVIAAAIVLLCIAGGVTGRAIAGVATSQAAGAPCAVTSVAQSVPKSGVMFGVNLDWGSQSLSQFAGELGKRPDVAVSFASFPMDRTTIANVVGAADQVRSNGGTLLLTLEPQVGLAAVTDAAADGLAKFLRPLNDSGVPVIVRFAHEMNGSWYPWGQKPSEYVAAFRRVATALHRTAPATAMMWAPNYAGGYPFPSGAYLAGAGVADFALLDTNHDGALTSSDDAYAPYYPGDDVVDWVGMSLYHWGSVYPWGENELPEAGKFAAQLTGEYNGLNGDDRAAPDFYQVYGVDHDKPVAIPETAAFFAPGAAAAGASELAIKQAWWRQVVSDDTVRRFPHLKMVNWFNWSKTETEVNGVVDWSITSSSLVLKAFTSDVPKSFTFASKPRNCSAG